MPLTSNFKPQVKVLSRKPVLAKRNPATGLSQLTLDDDDEPKHDAKETQPTPEEIKAKQKRDLEERQKRYDEARAKIFGESASSSRGSSPGTGTVTPPRSDSRTGGQGRARGGVGRGGQRSNNGSSSNLPDTRQRQSNQPQARDRELYDPNYAPRADSSASRRADGSSSGRGATPLRDGTSTPPQQQQAIRSPRGPDGSGRGGFGFAKRGAKEV